MPDNPPLVTVTICCFNSERFIAQTIQSVLSQTLGEFELIILNDGSTDRTEEIVHSFGDPRIRYEYQDNHGLAAARNRTLELARGKYVAFLDHDDLWVPEKLALQIPILETRPDVSLVYANEATIDDKGRVISEGLAGFEPKDGNLFAELIAGNFICWQTVVMDRQVLLELGGFRPFRVAEDYDLLLRCAIDHNFVGLDTVLAYYRHHPDSYIQSHKLERLEELLELFTDLLANVPPQHRACEPILRRRLGDIQYSLGRQLCLEGNLSTGRLHLQEACFNSPFKPRYVTESVLAGLLGNRFYVPFATRRDQFVARIRALV